MMNYYRKLFYFTLRMAIYALTMVGLYFIFKHDAINNVGSIKITENSLTEISQEIFVFLVSLLFIIAGIKSKKLAPFLWLLSLIFVMSFIREFNNHINYWFYIVIPFIGLFVFLLIKNYKRVIESLVVFIGLRSSEAFCIGFLITYVFSRMFGITSFWEILLGDSYNRTARNIAEEGVELLGYSIILISVVELLVYIFKENKSNKQQQ